MKTPVTLLYAPGNRKTLMLKAVASTADVVVFDLEDAVTFDSKQLARSDVKEVFETIEFCKSVQIRINAMGTNDQALDISLLKNLPDFVEVRVPKVESFRDVEFLQKKLPGRKLHALIETALGVENAFEISSSGVSSIGLGEADLRSDLGLPAAGGDEGLSWSRSRILNAAAAAGIPQPMMSVYTNISDVDGLFESSLKSKNLGFLGRAAIHPVQLEPIRKAFTPTSDEFERANKILTKLETARHRGSGVIVLEDGSFLDAAMIESANQTVNIYRHINNIPVSGTWE